jgi:AraC family transcriptional regulator, regulatory protein of adaptative response / methylphosphotriester-DNA alkyltransferase methyltransferase
MPKEAISENVSLRKQEIVDQYLGLLDEHVAHLKAGTAEKVFEIREFAAMMFMHPVHLSNTIKEVTGQSTCDHFESRLLKISKELILESSRTITEIARHLMYDPSNFVKFFKAYTGLTPKKFRDKYSKS